MIGPAYCLPFPSLQALPVYLAFSALSPSTPLLSPSLSPFSPLGPAGHCDRSRLPHLPFPPLYPPIRPGLSLLQVPPFKTHLPTLPPPSQPSRSSVFHFSPFLSLSQARLVIVAGPARPTFTTSPIHFPPLLAGPACHCGRYRLPSSPLHLTTSLPFH